MSLNSFAATALAACCALPLPTFAVDVALKALMVPKEQIRLDFTDGSKHFLAMVKREGKAQGSGPLSGAAVTEFGYHDIMPGDGGEPRGYLVFALPDGDTAYIKWQVRAVYVPGADGKPKLLDNGFWEVAGATGKLKGLKGAGILHIKAVSPTEREFALTGDLVDGP